MARICKNPKNAITLATFAELVQFVRAFAEGHFNFLLVLGAPGLQKSHIVRKAVGDACWIEGNASPFRVYCKLWEERDRPVVIDDVDSFYADRNGVRLLKCLCQTESTKTVAWNSDAKTLDREGIPRQFNTTSRVVIIANEWTTLNANVAAVEDRAQIVLFEPSALEVHVRTAEWFWDQDIFDFIGERLHFMMRPSMRHYYQGWELKRAGLDWRDALLRRWLSGTRLLVAHVKLDPSFAHEEDRVRAFVEKGGGCRATYFNHTKKLEPPVGSPKILLKAPPPDQLSARLSVIEILQNRYGKLGNG